MKKIFALILVGLMVIGLAACGPKKPTPSTETTSTKATQATTTTAPTTTPTTTPETTTPAPDSYTEEVSLSDFYDGMQGDDLRWVCPAQYYNYYIEFAIEDDIYYIIMGRDDGEEDEYAVAKIDKVYYDGNSDLATLMLSELADPLPDNEFTIDLSRGNEGYIMAPNYYDDFKIVEYVGQAYVTNMMFELQDESLNKDYYPYLGLSSDGYFVYCENIYEGMVYFNGTFKTTDTEVICTVDYTEPEDLSGVAGGDTKEIRFEIDEDGNLVLEQDICFSYKGAVLTYTGEY